MLMSERKTKGRSYKEWFVAENVEQLIIGKRFIVVEKVKLEGVPPTYKVIFGSEDRKEAESEVTRLSSMHY